MGAFVLTVDRLALCGHAPLRLNRFLEDAHQRGVLRQARAVYQFCHSRLQDRLANIGRTSTLDVGVSAPGSSPVTTR